MLCLVVCGINGFSKLEINFRGNENKLRELVGSFEVEDGLEFDGLKIFNCDFDDCDFGDCDFDDCDFGVVVCILIT